MKKYAFVSMMALFVLAFACKKDISNPTQAPILGKWNLVSANWNEHIKGADHIDSAAYSSGELNIEFKSNGTVISSSPFHADTMPYKILNENSVLIDGNDTLRIKPLTSTTLQVYFRNLKNEPGDYYEEWDRLKK